MIDGQTYVSSKRASGLSGYTQDYIGQMSRGNQIQARRVGGLWYISADSLNKYKSKADMYKPEPPVLGHVPEVDSLVSLDGTDHVSAPRAAKLTGYTQDYVGQLARAGTVTGRQIGNRWYVDREGILSHKKNKDALLAAVQAESVGIRRDSGQNDTLSHISYGSAGPFLKYTSDARELLPNLDGGDDSGTDVEREEFQIPIHIISSGKTPLSSAGYNHENHADYGTIHSRRLSEMTIYSLVLPAIMMTIVIVISLGFVSLKESSVYTDRSPESGGEKMLAAGAAAGALVEKMAVVLETLLAPELVYIRSN